MLCEPPLLVGAKASKGACSMGIGVFESQPRVFVTASSGGLAACLKTGQVSNVAQCGSACACPSGRTEHRVAAKPGDPFNVHTNPCACSEHVRGTVQAHPEDITGDACAICGGSEDIATDWISCDMCDSWVHFSCDKRPYLGAFKDYAKGQGQNYTCARCHDTKKRKQAAGS